VLEQAVIQSVPQAQGLCEIDLNSLRAVLDTIVQGTIQGIFKGPVGYWVLRHECRKRPRLQQECVQSMVYLDGFAYHY
jgi:hypothetical protein